MVEVVFETHSTSTDNEAGIATGWGQGQLSETGRRQARELGERRRRDSIAAVFTSDLYRAIETAEIAFSGSDLPIHQDRRLRECDYGVLNGMPVSRLAAERLRRVDEPFPGGQSYRQVVDQTRHLLRELAATWAGQRILLISHSANRWALDCLLGGARLEDVVARPFGWQEGWEYRLPAGWS
jgi:broad specificity phosphatase PhoE